MVSITGLLVADGLGTVLPVVLLRALVSLCRGWVWAADLRRSRHVAAQNDAVFTTSMDATAVSRSPISSHPA
jgi:hypothetical protein